MRHLGAVLKGLFVAAGAGLLAACSGTEITSGSGQCRPQQLSDVNEDLCTSSRRVSVFVAGDVLLHRRLQNRGYASGFDSIWADAEPFIRGADIAYANLETPTALGLARGGVAVANSEKRFDDHVYSSFPMFNVHPDLIGDLARSGFDVMSTANNHALDRGGRGAEMTIAALQQEGLAFTGTRDGERSQEWWTVTNSALGRIAWIACTYSTNGVPDPARRVLNCYDDRSELLGEVRALSSRNDIAGVIVTPHWGYEYQHQPNPRQRSLNRDLAAAGAMAVIGAHSHVVGPWAETPRPGGSKMLTMYSTGNFVSGQVGLRRQASMLGWMELCQVRGGGLAVAQAGYVPTYLNRITSRGPELDIVGESSSGVRRQAYHLVRDVIGAEREARVGERCLSN